MTDSKNDIPSIANVQLKKYSCISYAIERFFRLLQFFPPQVFVGNRTDILKKKIQEKSVITVSDTIKRSRIIEMYILVCLLVEFILIIAINKLPEYNILWLILVFLRIIDIIQVTINMNIFDPLRVNIETAMASVVRTLILSLINYIELIICFGLFYLANFSLLAGATNWMDSFYFSVITQLTIGYGDVTPLGELRFVVIFQALLGLLFTIFILGRFFSLLPKINPFFQDKGSSQ